MLGMLDDQAVGWVRARGPPPADAAIKRRPAIALPHRVADSSEPQDCEAALHHLPGRRCWAVEGAGSFGAGLAGFLQQRGERVVEVSRPKRPAHRTGANSDTLDAIRAAREALGQDHLATPRRRGDREALRVLLTTRRSATTARVAAIGQLEALIVGAPEELRAELRGRSTSSQIACCASLRERPTRSLEHRATIRALRVTAQRIQSLQAEPTSSRPSSPCWWVRLRLRTDPDTRAYMTRRTAQGKSRRDAKRCLRRVIARQLFQLLERYDQPGVEVLRAA
jgi:hypothetical protein